MKPFAALHDASIGRRGFIRNLGAGAMAVLAGNLTLSQAGCGRSESVRMPTRTEMKTALKDRIQLDDPGNFNSNLNNWDQVRLGIYYDEDKELIDIAVYETTANIVAALGKFLPGPVWRNLLTQVGPGNTPEQVVDPMMDAAVRSVRRQQNDEGPISDRPPQKPTLRSARKPTNG